MTAGGKRSIWGNLLLGLLVAGMGLFPMLSFFDLGPLGRADINGPPWLGLVSGGIFVVAGLVVMAGDSAPGFKNFCAIVILLGLAALGNWVAFGAGERVCSGSISIPFFADNGAYAGLACRIPFALGAAIVDAFMLVVVAKSLQKALGGPPRLAPLVKFSEGLILVALAPFLLLLVLFLALRVGFDVVKTRLQTGSWPRNQDFINRRRNKKIGSE